MKTVGNLLKEARIKKGLSRKELEDITHIKTSFIIAIENSDWKNLPEFATVNGFVKSISHFLDVNERQAAALLRRDYPVELLPVAKQKKEREPFKNFRWGPRLTFLAGTIIIISIVLGYLVFQFQKFNSPPVLIVNKPSEGQVVNSSLLSVDGQTNPDATIEVNGQPVIVTGSGRFTAQINISKDTTKIEIIAKGRSGKETIISRTIKH